MNQCDFTESINRKNYLAIKQLTSVVEECYPSCPLKEKDFFYFYFQIKIQQVAFSQFRNHVTGLIQFAKQTSYKTELSKYKKDLKQILKYLTYLKNI